ncbi:MAG: NAD(P)/FAD-dependent oxidoreductase [Anaerolineae bacterium]
MATDVIVIGAGLSGLIAAQQLKEAGKSFIVLDKGRSVGGRLATRRIGAGQADHGAQFFTARTDTFQQQVDAWLEAGIVDVWGYGWSDGSLKRTQNDGHPRYITNGGMNQLAQTLAQSLGNAIHVNSHVHSVSWDDQQWFVSDAESHIYVGRVLIMTPPVPQSLALLDGVPLAPEEREQLQRVQYGPCLCGLFVVEGEIDLPEPGALQNFDNTVYWLADNQQKGISPDERIITVHINALYSRAHYDDSDEELLAFMREELEKHMSADARITEQQIKRWRYSVPLVTYPRDILQSEQLPVIFAGDAFGGRGRVEGAYMSGLAAGQAALDLL